MIWVGIYFYITYAKLNVIYYEIYDSSHSWFIAKYVPGLDRLWIQPWILDPRNEYAMFQLLNSFFLN